MSSLFSLNNQEEERALETHRRATIFDSLGGFSFPGGMPPTIHSSVIANRLDELTNERRPPWDVLDDLAKLTVRELVDHDEFRSTFHEIIRRAGVTAISATIGELSGPVPYSYENAIKDLARWTNLFDRASSLFVKVTRAQHVRMAKKEDKFGIALNTQNSSHIGSDIDKLDFFYDLGVRQVQLTYNMRNLVGDGCTERTDSGLSNFGLEVVARLNELGVLVDVSHCGHRTTMDAIEASKDPVIFSHTNCFALCKHARNKTDKEITALADKGGYIGLTVLPFFLTEKATATLENFLDHVDHVVELVGVDHVGIGTDDQGVEDSPKKFWELYTDQVMPMIGFRPEHRATLGIPTKGYEKYRDWPNFTRGLVSRGYSDQEIEKILGGNFLSIFERVVG